MLDINLIRENPDLVRQALARLGIAVRVEAAERVFNMPVRVGIPRDIAGLKDVVATPQYANGVGLLKYGIKMSRFRTKSKSDRSGGMGSFGTKFRKFLDNYF